MRFKCVVSKATLMSTARWRLFVVWSGPRRCIQIALSPNAIVALALRRWAGSIAQSRASDIREAGVLEHLLDVIGAGAITEMVGSQDAAMKHYSSKRLFGPTPSMFSAKS